MLNRIIMGAVSPCTDSLKEGALIVDVRTKEEFAQGHVNGSVNIPVDEIHTHVKSLAKENKPLVLCCASGMRSARATRILKDQGLDACNGGSWKTVHATTK